MAVWSEAARGVIPAPVDKVWAVVSDFGGLKKWNTSERVKSCEMILGDPKTAGSVRSVTFDHGGSDARMSEVLLEFDEEQHQFKYKIEEPPPFLAGMVTSVKLNRTGDDSATEVVWSYECPADPSNAAQEQILLSGVLPIYESSIEILKSHKF